MPPLAARHATPQAAALLPAGDTSLLPARCSLRVLPTNYKETPHDAPANASFLERTRAGTVARRIHPSMIDPTPGSCREGPFALAHRQGRQERAIFCPS